MGKEKSGSWTVDSGQEDQNVAVNKVNEAYEVIKRSIDISIIMIITITIIRIILADELSS